MDKDRVIGSAKVVKGKVKAAAGKAAGDAKLEAEGEAEKAEGQVQNAAGNIKDTVRGVAAAPQRPDNTAGDQKSARNRNLLFILIGVLAAGAAGAGYLYYQERQGGIIIKTGELSVPIDGK